MAAAGNNIVRFTYTGADGEYIPDGVTHITIDKSCTFVRANSFRGHRNIVELVCHVYVEKIERHAFNNCPSLRRVIMPGVKIVEPGAFNRCTALTDVQCGMLKIVAYEAFRHCESLGSINLPSATNVEQEAFDGCRALTDAKFGRCLERIESGSFNNCQSLERITIPLKDDIITNDPDDYLFQGCEQLKHVDLVERAELLETIACLWRNDMNEKIDSINQILPNTPSGEWDEEEEVWSGGRKARVIRGWIRSVLSEISHYKASKEVVTALQPLLPPDIAKNHVLPFLRFP